MIDSSSRLYGDLVLERYNALIASKRFLHVRSKWLRKFNKRVLFNSMDAWEDFYSEWQHTHTPDLLILEQNTEYLSTRFSLAECQILWGLFIKEYKPLSEPPPVLPASLRHPRAAIHVGQLPSSKLEHLSQALCSTNIQLILDPSLQHNQERTPQIPLNLNLELPIDIPIRYAVDLVRSCRRQSVAILNQAEIDTFNPSNQDRISSYLICSEGDDEFIKAVRSIADSLELDLEYRAGSFNKPGPVPNPYTNLQIGIKFAPSVPSLELVRAAKQGIYAARRVGELLGINTGQRLRASPVTKFAAGLNVNGEQLSNRGIGDLILDQLGDFPRSASKGSSEIKKLRGTLKSRRNQILQRFRHKGLLNQ